MRIRLGFLLLTALFWTLSSHGSAVALDVTFDSGGSGSTTLVDTDLDHIIDFDLMVGGVFRAKGRVVESLNPFTKIVTITTTPPDSAATFGRIGVGAGTAAYTVTVNTSNFTPALAAPLGWSVAYHGYADTGAGPVDIPSHSVAASINNGAVPLGTLTGMPIAVPTPIDMDASGVEPSVDATTVRIVFTMTVGPNNQILLPDNNGFDNKSIEVDIFDQSAKCVDQMNNRARQVGQVAGKSDANCVKHGTGNVTGCVDGFDPKALSKQGTLINKFSQFCVPLPAWGVNGDSCCHGGASDGALCPPSTCPGGGICLPGTCIAAAARSGANDVSHDLFGGTVNVSPSSANAKCQAKVANTAERLYAGHWKAFRRCKKEKFTLIMNDADLVSMCLGPPQADTRSYVFRAFGKLSKAVQVTCAGKGVSPVGAQFPGDCTAASDANFATCVAQRVACRFCQAVNDADAISPPLNCDVFDDNTSNSSCP